MLAVKQRSGGAGVRRVKMRRFLTACLAAVLASGYALTPGSADTAVASLPDAKDIAKQILAPHPGHFMTVNARAAFELAAPAAPDPSHPPTTPDPPPPPRPNHAPASHR